MDMARKGTVRPELGSLMLEITGRCNHDCLYCYNVWKRPQVNTPREIDTEGWFKIIDKTVDMLDYKSISFTGGEPAMRTDLPKLVRYAKEEYSLKATVISNGTLLTGQLINELASSGLSLLEITVLTHDSNIHSKLTGKDTLKNVLKGATNATDSGIDVVIGTVGTKLNIGQVNRVIDIAFALGAKGFMFNRFNPGGKGLENIEILMPTIKQIENALHTLNIKAKEYKIPVTANVPIPPCVVDTRKFNRIKFGYCPAGGSKAYYTISPSGNVRLCNHSSKIIGNVSEVGIIAENGKNDPLFTEMPVKCNSCSDFALCRGSCRAAAEECYGDLSHMDPIFNIT
jgi:radical SAM protein with 4Fe4S-binding SPASM domain